MNDNWFFLIASLLVLGLVFLFAKCMSSKNQVRVVVILSSLGITISTLAAIYTLSGFLIKGVRAGYVLAYSMILFLGPVLFLLLLISLVRFIAKKSLEKVILKTFGIAGIVLLFHLTIFMLLKV